MNLLSVKIRMTFASGFQFAQRVAQSWYFKHFWQRFLVKYTFIKLQNGAILSHNLAFKPNEEEAFTCTKFLTDPFLLSRFFSSLGSEDCYMKNKFFYLVFTFNYWFENSTLHFFNLPFLWPHRKKIICRISCENAKHRVVSNESQR